MNRYITVDGYVLELSILLGLIILIVVAVVTVMVFFFDFSLKKPAYKRMVIPIFGLVFVALVFWFLVYDESLYLDHSPKPFLQSSEENYPAIQNDKQPYKFRYTISNDLQKLGFLNEVYDDGNKTYFSLNSLNIPKVFIEDGSGNLIDQKDYLSIQDNLDNSFPVLIVDRMSSVWYLQFIDFISHVIQNPVFKPSYDSKSVEVSYSDLYFATIDLNKDSFVCDQISPEDRAISIPRARHYFVFDNIRYYVNDCFDDYSSKMPQE